MGKCKTFVKYIITSKDLDTHDLTIRTGINPSEVYQKGETYVGKFRSEKTGCIEDIERKRFQSYWSIKSEIKSSDIQKHIKNIFRKLKPSADIFKELLNSENCLIRFYVRIDSNEHNIGCEFDSDVLKIISAFSNQLCISCWDFMDDA